MLFACEALMDAKNSLKEKRQKFLERIWALNWLQLQERDKLPTRDFNNRIKRLEKSIEEIDKKRRSINDAINLIFENIRS